MKEYDRELFKLSVLLFMSLISTIFTLEEIDTSIFFNFIIKIIEIALTIIFFFATFLQYLKFRDSISLEKNVKEIIKNYKVTGSDNNYRCSYCGSSNVILQDKKLFCLDCGKITDLEVGIDEFVKKPI